MINNHSIHTLGLARNLIGNEEYKKTTDPGLRLGGDGIAKMLEENQTLTSLDVQYNQLRQTSAVAIGKALKLNHSLVILKAGFNSFGDLGTQHLGSSLKTNRTLEHLDLKSNSLVPKSVCVLANALSHNDKLRNLILDDNILGRLGAQAVAAAIQRSSQAEREWKLVISFNNSDCFKETNDLFDPGM
jgi:Ran GTPase-activating protein (RanGAP) involved in mRNA processing and transport|tara:strand:- start:21 stop:581 length:561 start_codon:yes stop_codon:yes gene_type:complete